MIASIKWLLPGVFASRTACVRQCCSENAMKGCEKPRKRSFARRPRTLRDEWLSRQCRLIKPLSADWRCSASEVAAIGWAETYGHTRRCTWKHTCRQIPTSEWCACGRSWGRHFISPSSSKAIVSRPVALQSCFNHPQSDEVGEQFSITP